ncbi:MAG TPA: hypothetical protein QF564_26265 [Pirellulaceae bacterium]|nr:hypothetical protein [Pirellulaceae bacterium]
MNRLMLVVMIATAVCLHCTFCEWDLCKHEAIVSESRSGRVLFYHYDRAWNNDHYLLSKSTASRDDALLYGLGVPLLLFGAAMVVIRLEGGSTGS